MIVLANFVFHIHFSRICFKRRVGQYAGERGDLLIFKDWKGGPDTDTVILLKIPIQIS